MIVRVRERRSLWGEYPSAPGFDRGKRSVYDWRGWGGSGREYNGDEDDEALTCGI
jgi:hypothetical protein